MQPDPDLDYLAALDAELRALDDRETAEQGRHKAEMAQIAEKRHSSEAARAHFLTFLSAKGKAPAPPQGTLLPGVATDAIPLPLRMGDQRRLLLESLVRTPFGLTVKAIAHQTGVAPKVIYTFAQRDTQLGVLERAGDRLVLTPRGRDYMRRVAEKFGPGQKLKAPPAEAGGVFQ